MKVEHIPCGPYANESERLAVAAIKAKLQSVAGDGKWILLSNLSLSISQKGIPDEIDLVVIGPPGVLVIEVKHWQKSFLKSQKAVVIAEATKLNNKVRKVASKVRRVCNDIGFLTGQFLITNESSKFNTQSRPVFHGCEFFILSEWKILLAVDSGRILSDEQVTSIARALEPKIRSTLDGQLRRVGHLINLELISPVNDRFHRVFKGQHTLTRDKVVVHLYDASAFDGKDAEKVISREFTVIQRLQKSRNVPRIMDSYQALPDYAGELFFFSLADPSAPTLERRLQDKSWDSASRRIFARSCCLALKELHNHKVDGKLHFVHRNITPKTILVSSNDEPIFTAFHLSKTASTATVATDLSPSKESTEFQSIEVISSGLSAADQRSDVFSLCATLKYLFETDETDIDELSALIELGTSSKPDERPSLDILVTTIDEIAGNSQEERPLPDARYWSEGLVVPFRDRYYRIISRIGSGSFGTTFKVIEEDSASGEQFGTYLAKIIYSEEVGEQAIKAYRRTRAQTRAQNLSTIYELGQSWSPNSFISLMEWVEGSSLDEWKELTEPYSEELGYENPQNLILAWLQQSCAALGALHKVGLVHGDVSLNNLIESSGKLTLTDFDSVQQAGAEVTSEGTLAYSAPFNGKAEVYRDIFALAASFFHLIWGVEPFHFGGNFRKDQGLNWEDIETSGLELVCEFLNKATDLDLRSRFENALDAASWLNQEIETKSPVSIGDEDTLEVSDRVEVESEQHTADVLSDDIVLTNNTVDWLKQVLQSYPGSKHGNSETRGLDSDFALQTYVETKLESKLLDEIESNQINLVILCGNAGDGKTAFLQHLAIALGLSKRPSSERVWKIRQPDGRRIMANLDGSAAHKDKSSDELLNDLFEPFHQIELSTNDVHLVAINDGRLLEWVNYYEQENEATRLTEWISDTLAKEQTVGFEHLRLIDLNNRSLVGGYDGETSEFTTGFVNKLVNKLICSDRFEEVWLPCQTCTAKQRCTAYGTASLLYANDDMRSGIREQLYAAFQAVHQRGEIHITARELRSALSYIIFGIDHCIDLHEKPDLIPERYFDRAFDADSLFRQGDLLSELPLFDPSLESHPHIDRYLKSSRAVSDGEPSRYPKLSLTSARRRAYFEWTAEEIELVGGKRMDLTLSRGQYIDMFRRVPEMSNEEKEKLKNRLLEGMSRLENLPRIVLSRAGVTPLKVSPRTPVETCFWIDKPNHKFSLEAELYDNHYGYETLHRFLALNYRYDENSTESLHLNSELFNILIELSEGFQLSDAFSADTFAHLSVFTQRLGQEDQGPLLAWNPSQEHLIHELNVSFEDGLQKLKLIQSSHEESLPNG